MLRDALSTAQDILGGKLDVLTGAATVCKQLHRAGLGNDLVCNVFVGVASESDHLPLGADRQYWNAEALRHKDEEIQRVANFYRDRVLAACRMLIERFGGNSDGS